MRWHIARVAPKEFTTIMCMLFLLFGNGPSKQQTYRAPSSRNGTNLMDPTAQPRCISKNSNERVQEEQHHQNAGEATEAKTQSTTNQAGGVKDDTFQIILWGELLHHNLLLCSNIAVQARHRPSPCHKASKILTRNLYDSQCSTLAISACVSPEKR